MVETLSVMSQIATVTRPSPVETSLHGLEKPFVEKGREPYEKSKTAQAMQTVKEMFYLARISGQTEFTTQDVLRYLYANQAGTNQSALTGAILDGLLTLTETVEDHGGGTRRLCSPSIAEPGKNEPTDDSFPAGLRWQRNELLKVNGDSEIPVHEVLAAKVITNLSHPHNMDWKAAINQADLPKFAKASCSSILRFLNDGKFQHTIHEAADKSWVEIHVDDVDAFWHDIPVLGYYRPKAYNTRNEKGELNLKSEKYAFYFGPEEKPEKFVIRVGLDHPQGNPNWTTLHVTMGPALNGEFVDVRDIYFSPKPTPENGLLSLDQRDGLVDDRQAKLCTYFHRNGTATLPDYQEYQKHQSRIPSKAWPQILTDINRMVNLTGRLIRYSNHLTTLWNHIGGTNGYPSTMPGTMEDLTTLTVGISNRLKAGEKISEVKIEEIMGNLVVACHNNKNHIIFIINRLCVLFQHEDAIRTLTAFEPQALKSADGISVVHNENTNITTWSSGISRLLKQLSLEIEKYRQDYPDSKLQLESVPHGSPLAQLLWVLEPRNN